MSLRSQLNSIAGCGNLGSRIKRRPIGVEFRQVRFGSKAAIEMTVANYVIRPPRSCPSQFSKLLAELNIVDGLVDDDLESSDSAHQFLCFLEEIEKQTSGDHRLGAGFSVGQGAR